MPFLDPQPVLCQTRFRRFAVETAPRFQVDLEVWGVGRFVVETGRGGALGAMALAFLVLLCNHAHSHPKLA